MIRDAKEAQRHFDSAHQALTAYGPNRRKLDEAFSELQIAIALNPPFQRDPPDPTT